MCSVVYFLVVSDVETFKEMESTRESVYVPTKFYRCAGCGSGAEVFFYIKEEVDDCVCLSYRLFSLLFVFVRPKKSSSESRLVFGLIELG